LNNKLIAILGNRGNRIEYNFLFFQFLTDIKIGMNDIEEAIYYLEENFIKEFGINIKILKNICDSIPKEKYPRGKKRFYSAVRNFIK
jgi:hypothetical protein